jgi:predicted deacylase
MVTDISHDLCHPTSATEQWSGDAMRILAPRGVDLDAPGRQVGVAVVGSLDRAHGYVSTPVPIAVLANGDGPTVVLTAGSCSGAYGGQAMLRRFIRETRLSDISGRVIVAPTVNLTTAAIADFVETELMSRADYAVDLGSGRLVTEDLPCTFLRIDEDDHRTREKIAAAEAFGLGDVFVITADTENQTIFAAADRHNTILVTAELGSTDRVSREITQAGTAGLSRLLDHWNVLRAPFDLDSPGPTRFLRLAEPAIVPIGGVLEPLVTIGDHIERHQIIGRMRRIYDLEEEPVDVTAQRAGIFAMVAVHPTVSAGGYACTVAVPTPPRNGRIPELSQQK